jgi:hypothetical protein
MTSTAEVFCPVMNVGEVWGMQHAYSWNEMGGFPARSYELPNHMIGLRIVWMGVVYIGGGHDSGNTISCNDKDSLD